LLIISEVVQQAMIANDNSMLNATLLVITLVGLDIGLSIWKHHSAAYRNWLTAPVVLIQDGNC
jgi:uncharacterized membrane protein YcaP (DUF421 family)